MVRPCKASVSLCIIVRNEAQQLAACLEPVAELFDELIIVDTGSIDDTAAIARDFTPHVINFAWCDDFSAARNECLRHAQSDWIFWLDADDRINPGNVARLRALLQSLDERSAVYMMDTACVPSDACDVQRLISHIRLFPRRGDLKWAGRVHEQLRPCPSQLGLSITLSDVQIEHVGYRDAALAQRKRKRDVRLLRMDYAVDPDEPRTLLHLGMAYAQLGQPDEARKYLLRLLSLTQKPYDYLRRVVTALAELDVSQGNFHSVVQITAQGLSLFPDDEHLAYLQAEALYELDQYPAAQALLERIIARSPSAHYHGGTPDGIRRQLAPRSLIEVLRIQGRYAAAESVAQQMLTDFARDTVAWHALGRVYIDTGDAIKLNEVVARLQDCPQGPIFASLLVAAWRLMRGPLDQAEPVIDQLIAQAPHMPMPRIMRAHLLERTGAPAVGRLQACRDVLRVQPGNAHAAAMVERLQAELQQPAAANPPDVSTSLTLGACIGVHAVD